MKTNNHATVCVSVVTETYSFRNAIPEENISNNRICRGLKHCVKHRA